jgi:hypothetical protein
MADGEQKQRTRHYYPNKLRWYPYLYTDELYGTGIKLARKAQ